MAFRMTKPGSGIGLTWAFWVAEADAERSRSGAENALKGLEYSAPSRRSVSDWSDSIGSRGVSEPTGACAPFTCADVFPLPGVVAVLSEPVDVNFPPLASVR